MNHSQRRQLLAVTAILCWAVGVVAAEVSVTQTNGHYVLENDYVRLTVNPAKGGVIDQYLVKATGKQLVGDGCFLLGDHFWQQSWPGEFLNAPYEARVAAQTGRAVTLEVSRVSQGWQSSTAQSGLRLTRRLTLTTDSPALQVEIAIENTNSVGRKAGYWSQNILYPGGKKEDTPVYFRPSVRGTSMSQFDAKTAQFSFTAEEPATGFVHDPQQGWMAVLGEQSHSGLAFVMRYDELMFLYNCTPSYTTEWQYQTAGIPAGKAWRTDFVVYPVADLPRVDYASRALAAAVDPSDAAGKLHVVLNMVAAGLPLENVTVTPEIVQVRQGGKTLALPSQQLAHVRLKPQTLNFSAPHDPAEPLVLRFRVTGARAGERVAETFETWYGAQYGRNWQVDLSPLYALPTPERHVTFLKPDRIEKLHNEKPQVLFGKGMYATEYLPSEVFTNLGAEVTRSYFTPADTWPAALSVFPVSYEDLMALDIIALINVDAAALGDTGLEMLKDFVHHGGTLVYGGDLWAYSRGNAGTGTMAELLPVRFATKDATVTDLQGPPVLVVKDGKTVAPLAGGAVMEYATESFTLKDGAEVLLACGARPVVVAWTVGQGRVVAITGTVLGEPVSGRRLFTRTPEWAACMGALLRGTAAIQGKAP